MRFVFLGPGLCLQLPSDPASRRRPCCSAKSSGHHGLWRDSHPPSHFPARFPLPVPSTGSFSRCFAPCLAHQRKSLRQHVEAFCRDRVKQIRSFLFRRIWRRFLKLHPCFLLFSNPLEHLASPLHSTFFAAFFSTFFAAFFSLFTPYFSQDA